MVVTHLLAPQQRFYARFLLALDEKTIYTLRLPFLLLVSLAFCVFDTVKEEAIYFEDVLSTRKTHTRPYMAFGILSPSSVS